MALSACGISLCNYSMPTMPFMLGCWHSNNLDEATTGPSAAHCCTKSLMAAYILPSCHAEMGPPTVPAFVGVSDFWNTAMQCGSCSQQSLAPHAARTTHSVYLLHPARLVVADCPAQRGTSATALFPPSCDPAYAADCPCLTAWTALQGETSV